MNIFINQDSKVSPESNHASSDNNEYVEADVCHENDIGENEMKNFEFESADICTKVLVIKQKGKISAVGKKNHGKTHRTYKKNSAKKRPGTETAFPEKTETSKKNYEAEGAFFNSGTREDLRNAGKQN